MGRYDESYNERRQWNAYMDYYNNAVIRGRTPKTYDAWRNGPSWVKVVGWSFGILLAVCLVLQAIFG